MSRIGKPPQSAIGPQPDPAQPERAGGQIGSRFALEGEPGFDSSIDGMTRYAHQQVDFLSTARSALNWRHRLNEERAELQNMLNELPVEDPQGRATILRERIAAHDEKMPEADLATAHDIRSDFFTLRSVLAAFNKQPHPRETDAAITARLRELADAPGIREEVSRIFPDGLPDEELPELLDKINDRTISDAALIQATVAYVETRAAETAAYTAEFEELKAAFAERVQQAVAEHALPYAAADNLAQLDRTHFVIMDVLAQPYTYNPNHGWAYNDMGTVGIRSDLLGPHAAEERRHAIFHELVHQISGHAYLAHRYNDGLLANAYIYKLGLQLYNDDGSTAWFHVNEAITEGVALHLSGYQTNEPDGKYYYAGAGSYPDERRFLDEAGDGKNSAWVARWQNELLEAYFANILTVDSAADNGQYLAILEGRDTTSPESITLEQIESRSILAGMPNKLAEFALYQGSWTAALSPVWSVEVTTGNRTETFAYVGDQEGYRLAYGKPLAEADHETYLRRVVAGVQQEYGGRVSVTLTYREPDTRPAAVDTGQA